MNRTLALLLFCVALANCLAHGAVLSEKSPISTAISDNSKQRHVGQKTTFSINVHTNEAQRQLSQLLPECSKKHFHSIEYERQQALENLLKCSYAQVFRNITSLAIDTAEYFINVAADTTSIIADFSSCSTKFNPFELIYCIIKSIWDFPRRIWGIFEATEVYKDELFEIIPKIYRAISGCSTKSSNNYKLMLDHIISEAKQCNANI